jgi:transcriptional enhancer factor
MATKEDDKKRHRAREASNPYHLSHMTGRHHPQRTAASKYEYGASTPQLWSGFGALQSSLPTGLGLNGFGPSPYAVADFTMVVEDDEQRVHDFTKLFSDGRQGDLNASDATSWHQKYPEFEFLRAQREEWAKKNQRVLVCDASIKVMTETRPNAHLLIAFNLHSQRDLSQFESLECTTRFFDNGSKAPDHQFDGSSAHDLKEHRTSCEYTHDPHGCNSRLRLAFGSKFWVHRMSRYQSLRHKDESLVSRSLLRLTATQDVYGIKRGTGEAECILTILWRFRQTRDSAEVGAMKWRAVSFSDQYPAPKPEWVKQEDHIGSIDDMSSEQILDCSATAAAETPLYHQPSNLPLEYQHPQIQNPYVVQPILNQPPPQLHIDTLSHMAFSAPDLEQPSASAAPSTATDYSSHHGLNLSHNQDTVAGFGHDTDYDYGNHHIGMPSAFEPAINMSAYESFASQSAGLDGLNALAGLDHDNLLSLGLSSNDMVHVSGGAGIPDADLCYSTKPSWHHGSNLIHTLESAAAADPYHPFVSHNQTSHGHQVYEPTHGEELVSHGLHNGGVNVNVNAGLWNLQSPFHEDTSGGANLLDCRKGHGQGLGLGVLDMIERDQRARGY